MQLKRETSEEGSYQESGMRCFDINNFYFILFYFSDFIEFSFLFLFLFLLNDEEAHDIAVT